MSIHALAFHTFRPPVYLRHGYVQTVLGSLRRRRLYAVPVLAGAQKMILTTREGARLSGAWTPPANGAGDQGIVILLHGWEGSIASTYVVSAAHAFHSRGYGVFRLNLRDHGDSHALNEGLFYATLLDETYDAVVQAAGLSNGGPVFLCGFSLGGNFALRIARRWSQSPPPGIDLRHVAAVSPVLDPARATDAIDGGPFRHYFVGKWRRSLKIKQGLFPERYDFSEVLALPTVRAITETLLARYSIYRDAEDYFSRYAMLGDALNAVRIPVTVITSTDDPVIPVDDFHRLTRNPRVRLLVQPCGGHNGFVTNLRGGRWTEEILARCFEMKDG